MTQRGVSVRMSLRYTVPARSSLCDLFELVQSPSWVAYVSHAMVPYLKSSTPADATVLGQFTPIHGTTTDMCVICMSPLGPNTARSSAVQTDPCGHRFHAACIASWLALRSTCPTCRHQFPKQIRGSYAIRGVNTALVMPSDLSSLAPSGCDAMQVNLEGRTIRTIVHVTLVEVEPSAAAAGAKFACELNATLIGDQPTTATSRRLGQTKRHISALNEQLAGTIKSRREGALKQKLQHEPPPPATATAPTP